MRGNLHARCGSGEKVEITSKSYLSIWLNELDRQASLDFGYDAFLDLSRALGVAPEDFPQTPGLVINELLKKTGKSLEEIDVIEINEAFAAVALVSNQIAGLDPQKVNVNGGAVALGHPIGASGARIILTLAYELKRRGGGLGIAAICSGGGQGDAVIIEVSN